jgi:hypothetical protein
MKWGETRRQTDIDICPFWAPKWANIDVLGLRGLKIPKSRPRKRGFFSPFSKKNEKSAGSFWCGDFGIFFKMPISESGRAHEISQPCRIKNDQKL